MSTLNNLEIIMASTAHDLNNIFSVLISYPDLIQMKLDSGEDVSADLNKLRSAAERGAGMLRDCTDVLRSSRPQEQIISLPDILSNICQQGECTKLHLDFPLIDMEFGGRANGGLDTKVSIGLLERVIINIVRNACESIGKDNPGRIDLFYFCDYPEYVVLEIQDTGGGLPTDQLDKIFDAFYTTKEAGKSGSGIGLTSARAIIENMGGLIQVENVGQGLNFKIFLPRAV